MSNENDVHPKTTKDDVFRKAWAACDTFRGLIDAAEYKDYVLVTLFWKAISDTWREHYDDTKDRYGGDEARLLARHARRVTAKIQRAATKFSRDRLCIFFYLYFCMLLL